MLLSAMIFVALNYRDGMMAGAAVPMATDATLALGALSLLAVRVPFSFKVFLAASAIIADIGAIVLASTQSQATFSPTAVTIAGVALLALAECNRVAVRRPLAYVVPGCLLWVAATMSGMHGGIAGLLVALAIPGETPIGVDQVVERADIALAQLELASRGEDKRSSNLAQHDALQAIQSAVVDVESPMLKMERALHGVVARGIVPLFVFANIGVNFRGMALDAVSWRVVLGITLGLLVGKSIGITMATWLFLRLANPAATIQWPAVRGVACVEGIGFTMSLFVAGIVFDDEALLASAKLGILAGSVLAGMIGLVLLKLASPVRPAADAVIPLRGTRVGLT